MRDIVKLISNSNARTTGKVNDEMINHAEKELNFKFNNEYRTFLENFGVLVSGSDEVFGLGVNGYLNVVNSTLEEREIHENSLEKYIVVQNYGTGDILITLDEQGIVYESRNNQNKKLYGSFSEFLEAEIL